MHCCSMVKASCCVYRTGVCPLLKGLQDYQARVTLLSLGGRLEKGLASYQFERESLLSERYFYSVIGPVQRPAS